MEMGKLKISEITMEEVSTKFGDTYKIWDDCSLSFYIDDDNLETLEEFKDSYVINECYRFILMFLKDGVYRGNYQDSELGRSFEIYKKPLNKEEQEGYSLEVLEEIEMLSNKICSNWGAISHLKMDSV